ncbi:hypothetical protein ACO0SA_000990 [Hanseniaspora valbyensis]
MPSNILNKISDKLTGHEESDDTTQSYGKSQQSGRASGYGNNDTDFTDYQSSDNAPGGRTTRSQTASNQQNQSYGQHKRGAFSDEMDMKNEDRTHQSNIPADSYQQNQSSSSGGYGQQMHSQGTSNMRGSRGYDDEYGSQQQSSSRGNAGGSSMSDKFSSAANNQYVKQGIDKGKDYISNNM